jgi:ABC-2 type transport system permease protein
MNALTFALDDSAIMLRRQLRHTVRYPSLTFFVVAMPVIFLLIFVYVLGGTMGAGLGVAGAGGDGRQVYLEFITPGILIAALAGVVSGVAITVAMDMTTGIIARFRTMSIARMSVLIGHVLGGMVQALLAVGFVLVVALVIGFRSAAGPMEWLGAIGLLALTSFALIWLAVVMGLVTDSVETASNLPMPLILLPFLGSGFVPTDSMPGPLRLFAEFQPFTPIIDTLRNLLAARPVGGSGVLAVAWCLAITAVSFLWARRLYNRDPIR